MSSRTFAIGLGSTPKRVLPGFGLSLGISLTFVSLMLLLPMTGLFGQLAGLSLAEYWAIVTNERVVASYVVTIGAAAVAAVVNAAFGLLLAWVLVRYTFPGKRLLDALMDLPFALPTAVAGITLATLYSSNGWMGQLLEPLGLQVAYTWVGIALAMSFTSIPFVVRTVQPVLEDMPNEMDEAALTLGASDFTGFRRVILPHLWPALVTGTGLAFVRSLGEFGAIIFIAGNMPYETEITALMIFVRLQEYDYAGASAIASVVLFVSLALLLAINVWQGRFIKRLHGGHG
ncbi:sulfate ABC transporter permease subunit CysT [Halomonas daqingensis]|uniref:Sulfate transport system permease protein CysT n=1 Tax=Billgrantia desiderata TaxID=52021 RepID=A0AAW4YRE1_9GAMM|nr:sulfate ABC transporter permease subunit CysT [Halomonas desiderata]MCE8013551.1 sulfate ABC transporter permease subunit CysT [Halomonas desiderata]MCE8030761.1 sulfate ABC transporter permease subunit CysT [Halomonas desiderata]MCE8041261.1 sulfate ABC transporter permease subunit CysT [Halomonas desiderata]MCE8045836.1 sulfate ABC transporter permease subunit CysT [Halomonas desiderata]MCE8051474.1 sulfate ABC transporter permease subunit CysT [Halomonas desiderata]